MSTDDVPALVRLATLASGIDVTAIPEDTATAYRIALLDLVGAWIVGRDTDSARVFASVRGEGSGTGDLLLSAAGSAAAAHALELDDVHSDVAGWHPSVAAVPPLLALGSRTPLHGADVLAGLVAGWEVGRTLAVAVVDALREDGRDVTIDDLLTPSSGSTSGRG